MSVSNYNTACHKEKDGILIQMMRERELLMRRNGINRGTGGQTDSMHYVNGGIIPKKTQTKKSIGEIGWKQYEY